MAHAADMNSARLTKIDIATANMEAMVKFYTEVFGLTFAEAVFDQHKHYHCKLGELEFGLAPNEPAQVSAKAEGVHQFHLRLANLDALITRAKKFGIAATANHGEVFLCDPDGHPWMMSSDSR